MTKHWKVNATNTTGINLIVHTATSDELVARDLNLPQGKSLIGNARRRHSEEPFSDAENHSNLAGQALVMHCRNNDLKLDEKSFEETAEPLPNQAPTSALGGDSGSFLMTIWEEKRSD